MWHKTHKKEKRPKQTQPAAFYKEKQTPALWKGKTQGLNIDPYPNEKKEKAIEQEKTQQEFLLLKLSDAAQSAGHT